MSRRKPLQATFVIASWRARDASFPLASPARSVGQPLAADVPQKKRVKSSEDLGALPLAYRVEARHKVLITPQGWEASGNSAATCAASPRVVLAGRARRQKRPRRRPPRRPRLFGARPPT